MALATLSIDLVAQLAALQEGMDKAGRIAEKQAAEIESRYAKLADAGRALGAALAGAISVAGLAAYVRTTIDGIDALNDLKDATGSSIENLSALEDIAARTGTRFETVGSALTKFNRVLAEAQPGSSMEQSLKAIGLSAAELRRLDPSEALLKTAQALAGYADDGDKARLVGDLFGKSMKEVSPLLNDLADAGKLNATVTAEQAAQAEKFNKQLAEFSKNSSDAARTIASDLLPTINGLFERLSTVPGNGRSWMLEVVSELRSLRLSALVTDIENLTGQLSRATPGSDSARMLTKALADQRAEYERLSRAAAEANERLKSALGVPQQRDAGGGRGFINPPMIKPGVTVPDPPPRVRNLGADKQQVSESATALAAYVRQLQATIDRTEDLSEVEKARAMLKGLGVEGEVPQVRELVLGLAEEADQRQRNLDFAKAMTAELQRQRAEQAGLDAEIARFSGRSEQDQKAALTARLEERLAAGEIFSPEELERIVKGIGGVKDVVVELDEASKNFAESVQQSLGETVRLSLAGDFDSIANLWGQMLLRMTSEAIAADLMRSLFPGLSTGKGPQAGTSMLGSVIGSFFGGLGGIFGGGRAAGGGVSAGRLYDVAEGGRPELLHMGSRTMLLMGKQGGQVSPATTVAPGGGAAGITIVQHNLFQGGASPNELAAWAQRTKAETLAAVADAQRRRYSGVAI